MSSASNATSKLAISYVKMPKLHMSLLLSYGISSHTSGLSMVKRRNDLEQLETKTVSQRKKFESVNKQRILPTIIRCSCLGPTKFILSFGDFGYIHIPYFHDPILEHENVSRFEVSVDDSLRVKGLQSPYNLQNHLPNVLLVDVLLPPSEFTYFFKQISIVGIFGHNAIEKLEKNIPTLYKTKCWSGFNLPKLRTILQNKTFHVFYDIGMFEACQNSHFIQNILFFFFIEFR